MGCVCSCICGAVNVRELFKSVVVYFGGLAYMRDSLFIYFLFIVKPPLPECKLFKGWDFFVYFAHSIFSV